MTSVVVAPRRGLWDTRRMLQVGGPLLLAVVCGIVVCLLGWRGVDQAAQAYRTEEVRRHGLILWDAGWYAGNFPLGYSVLFPPLGAIFGVQGVAVASAGGASWAFDWLAVRHFGRRPLGSWYFAVATVL